MTAGSSGTPLAHKLGITPGTTIGLLAAPEGFDDLLDVPADVTIERRAQGHLDMVISFHVERNHFERRLPAVLTAMDRAGALWVAWPTRASEVETDITADVVREVVRPIGLVDVKTCAVDDRWSGSKVVWRKARR